MVLCARMAASHHATPPWAEVCRDACKGRFSRKPLKEAALELGQGDDAGGGGAGWQVHSEYDVGMSSFSSLPASPWLSRFSNRKIPSKHRTLSKMPLGFCSHYFLYPASFIFSPASKMPA